MSCCQRAGLAPATGTRWEAASVPAVPGPQAPARLRFTGARALSLPVGTRRVLVHPGDEPAGLSEAERQVLWRSGLFEDAGP